MEAKQIVIIGAGPAGLTAAIEPALIIVLAVVVGTIVIAMFLPMVKIIGTVSGAGG